MNSRKKIKRTSAFIFLSTLFIMPVLLKYGNKTGPFRNLSIKGIYAGEISEGQKNFLIIKELYGKWQLGLYGSSNAFKRKLKQHLVKIIGKQIETDRSFIIESPGSLVDKSVVCNLLECRWFKLHGHLDVSDLKSLVEKDKSLVKKWWRSGILFTVSGRVRKFRIGRDHFGDTVELFLDIIKVHRP